MKVLWKPDHSLAICITCRAVYDLDGMNVGIGMNRITNQDTEHNSWLTCENCKHYLTYYQPVEPTLEITRGECDHCGVPVGERDIFCGRCGATQ